MIPINYYKKLPKKYNKKTPNPNYKKHNIEIPFRIMILGGTGSGKTTTLLDLLLQAFNGTFHNIIIFCRNKDEKLYNYLEELAGKKGLEKILHFIEIEDGSQIPTPENLLDEYEIDRHKEQTFIAFDDLSNEKNQKNIIEYFIRGRKLNMSLCYLAHSFYDTPKKLRLQLSHIFIKKLKSVNDLNLIIKDCSLNADVDDLKLMYHSVCGKQDISKFFMVDLVHPDDKYSFRDCYTPIK